MIIMVMMMMMIMMTMMMTIDIAPFSPMFRNASQKVNRVSWIFWKFCTLLAALMLSGGSTVSSTIYNWLVTIRLKYVHIIKTPKLHHCLGLNQAHGM